MIATEPAPVVFGKKYSVLGKSKKRFMPGRFSPISRENNLQLLVNLVLIVLL